MKNKMLKITREQFINYYESRFFNKCQEQLKLVGFSEDIPQKWFTYYVQKNGLVGIIKAKEPCSQEIKEYAVEVSFAGKPGPYLKEYNKFIVTNPYLNLDKHEFTKGVDIAIFYYDTLYIGIYPIIHKYATMIVDIGLSLNILTIIERMPFILNASSQNSKESLESVMDKLLEGDFSIALDKSSLLKENSSIDSISFSAGISGVIKELIELENYITGCIDMELGLIANYNGKREYISDGEHSIDSLALIPNIDNVITTLNEGCKEYNRLFNHNAYIELGDTWKIVKENAQTISSESINVEDNKNSNAEKGDENEKDIDRNLQK